MSHATRTIDPTVIPDDLNWEKGQGLVTAVAQDAITGAVLMIAFMDRAALERTLETGEMHYRSRTRGAGFGAPTDTTAGARTRLMWIALGRRLISGRSVV